MLRIPAEVEYPPRTEGGCGLDGGHHKLSPILSYLTQRRMREPKIDIGSLNTRQLHVTARRPLQLEKRGRKATVTVTARRPCATRAMRLIEFMCNSPLIEMDRTPLDCTARRRATNGVPDRPLSKT